MGEQANLFGSPGSGAKNPQENPADTAANAPRVLSVAEFNGKVDSILKGLFPGVFRIQGFVSSFARSYARGGHVYFDLHDKDPEDDSRQLAKIGLVMWRGTRRRLEAQIRELSGSEGSLDDQQVFFEVSVNFWVQGGRLSLVVEGIDLEASLGAQKLDRERILRRLEADDLLDRNGLLHLPAVPLRVALITSIESAAYHDFIKELSQAGIAFRLGCIDSRVQGAEQEASLQAAFARFGADAESWDLVVLIRGGGSRSDLMGFDSEALARTLALCPLPVLTGIGHEVDRSIADEVAHRSFKTPTAVAQYLVKRVESYLERQAERARSIQAAAERRLLFEGRSIDRIANLLGRTFNARLSGARERLARMAASLPISARQPIRLARLELLFVRDKIVASPGDRMKREIREIDHREERLRLLDPLTIMKRGFSLTRDAKGRLLRSTAGLAAGDEIRSQLIGGSLTSRVESITAAEENDASPKQEEKT